MKSLLLDEELQLVDLACYWQHRRTLAIADLHLGFERALGREGLLLPQRQLQAVRVRLSRIVAQLAISAAHPLRCLIINGDLRHSFGPCSGRELQELLGFLSELAELSERLVLVQGNHDGELAPLAQASARIELCAAYRAGPLLFIHGDHRPQELPAGLRQVIIGHEHPAIGLRDPVTGRVELYKCFLQGSYRGVKLLVQPAVNPLVQGSDLGREGCLSPLLDEATLPDFELYPIGDDGSVYAFGRLGQLLSRQTRQTRSPG